MIAGLTVAAVAVPQAMAYAMIAGLPAEYGLYTAIVMTAVGALLDSSRQLINGPTNAISIAVLERHRRRSRDRTSASRPPSCSPSWSASIQLGITLLRLGDLTRYISHSVIVGFTAGASMLLVLDQLKNLLGLQSMGGAHDHFLQRFWLHAVGGRRPSTSRRRRSASARSRWCSRCAGSRRGLGSRLLPELLIVVGVMAALVAWLGLDQRGVKVIGEIPAKLPPFAPARLRRRG